MSVSLTLVKTVGLAWMVCTNSPVCVEALTEGNDAKVGITCDQALHVYYM